MKAMLWHFERVTSGAHNAQEQLWLPLNTAEGCQGAINYMCLQNMIQFPGVHPVPGRALRAALSGNPNGSCRFLPIHSASFVGSQGRTGWPVR
jgi:hypothetical protein